MNADLKELVYEHEELAELDPARRRLALKRLLAGRLDPHEVGHALEALAADIDGAGVLDPWLRDPTVTDVLVNGPGPVWIEKTGVLQRTNFVLDREQVDHLTTRLAALARVRVDPSHPVADGRLPDGSRLHIVAAPVARNGPLISVRRFPRLCLQLDDLLKLGTLDSSQHARLLKAVTERENIVVSGGTGAGKTTLVDALLSLVPPDERVVIAEETPELHPSCAHVVALSTREPNAEGRGGVGLSALVKAALRMRPDRLVVGEVRGPEALIALGALSSGHPGSMLTVHADRGGAIGRLAYLASLGGGPIAHDRLERDFRSCFDLVVHLERKEGRRRVVEIERL